MEERIITVEKDVERINSEIQTIKSRITKQGLEIDNIDRVQQNFITDIQLIKQQTGYTNQTVNEIKDDIKIIRKEREQDHYIKPLETNAKLVWQVAGLVIALLVGFLLKSMFPALM